ncbi:MAG: hypothetical protein HY868_08195 [Chloroflexi bacterium]|nr:hypothetical protein [Chloroflexota bacterium]
MQRRVLLFLIPNLLLLILPALACQVFSRAEIAPAEPAPIATDTEPEAIALIPIPTEAIPAETPLFSFPITPTTSARMSPLTPTKTPPMRPGIVTSATSTVKPNATATNTARPTFTTTPTALPPTVTRTSTPSATQPPSFIKSVTLAQGVDLSTGSPVNVATVFPRNAVVHAIVALQNAPAQIKVKAVWYAVDVGNAAPPNTQISNPIEWITESGNTFVDFTQGPITLTGTYRVEIYSNSILAQTSSFSVK